MKSRWLRAWMCLLTGAIVAWADPNPRLAKRLQWFQEQEFGLFLHWGVYSQMGCIESWPLVWADRNWSNPGVTTREEMIGFRKKYWALNRTFNPVKFHPQSWATLARRAGMKYVVFTTKHHNGFSMFDTRMTDDTAAPPPDKQANNRHAVVAALGLAVQSASDIRAKSGRKSERDARSL
jgi:alpha-L-fucosidase